jgi:hypothetical protein
MTEVPHVLSNMRRPLVMILLATMIQTLPASAQTPAAAKPTAPATDVNAGAAAQAEFQARLKAYLELRAKLADTIKPLSVTPDSGELTSRQESLAAGIRTARKNAKQGDLIPAPVAQMIAKTVAADFKKRRASASVKQATLADVPDLKPVINKVYPAPEALPTMPPLLLTNLPRLPDNLQYRYYGRSVVLLDGDLEIIVDFIPGVLPPH